ncbi:hypothetical protein GZH46_02824, partial [Fragariocoptes setiger]
MKTETKQEDRSFKDKDKPGQIRQSNMAAAKAVADAVRTSLGPRGMDKMIQGANGDVTITNDGATILKQIQVLHPAAKMLVELSQAQDIDAGDGTTSVVVLAGSLLDASQKLLQKGIHPTIISDAFQEAAKKCRESLEQNLAISVDLKDMESLQRVASTSLNSKVVSQHSSLLAPIAVNAVLKIRQTFGGKDNVDLRNIKVIKKLGGTLDDTHLIEGLVLDSKFCSDFGSKKVEKAKIGLIQFCISPPKTDMDNQVVITDYTQMDRALRDERNYILNIVKQIKKAGCNVLLVQKSILRDALTDLALHFLGKSKIAVVKDVEREDVDFICKTLGCRPIASLDHFTSDHLVSADLVEEVTSAKYIKITGIQPNPVNQANKTVNILIRGSNKLVMEEADRSLHDALCVVRCLVKSPFLIPGGGAPEIHLSHHLTQLSHSMTGLHAVCTRAFAEALEIIPYTLAENAGLNPISTITELRQKHASGDKNYGINIRKGTVTDMLGENVLHPLLVATSAVTLASETTRSILKIDDLINTVR